MKRWTVLLFVIQFAVTADCLVAQEVGFLEKYALASDRQQVLDQLVPGTQEYYYFHALYFQSIGDLKKVDELLKPWAKRFGETNQLKVIQNRQALLKFDESPNTTYRFLEDRLNLNFGHQRKIPTAEQNLPSVLNPDLISTESLAKRALRKHGDTSGFNATGLEMLADRQLSKTKRRHLLNRIRYPDFPKLVELIVKDLGEKDSSGFGSISIHANLTIEQMEACLAAKPKLIDNSNFVNAYLRKLLPNDDVNWRTDRDEHSEYLNRLYDFTKRLNPAFNSLRACVIYRMLELGRKHGQYDRSLFMEYIQLPRQIGYVNPQLVKQTKSRSHIVNLGADYKRHIMLVPIVNDQDLVVDYLHHLLVNASNYNAFSPYIRDRFLSREFAIAKILNGKGGKERWASVLSPQEYKKVVNRVDLEFARTNKEFYRRGDDVEIQLFTKNVQSLIVKIYEINSFNYYRKYKREIDTNINLDGLVPNVEKTFDYSEEPVVRKLRTFGFDELANDGVYVVDFIGKGKSSRALIRRGRLSMVGKPTIGGQVFRVFNENEKQVKNASIWVAGSKYQANDAGVIAVPYSNQPGRRSAIISAGGVSSLQSFQQAAETYSLNAAIYTDRESLLFNQKSNVIIRPSLKVAGVPASVGLLSDVQLVITSVNQNGVSSTKRVSGLKLSDDEETVVEFVVPPRMKSIIFDLSCKVENVSQNSKQDLAVNRTYTLNQIDTSDEIQDVHLMPTREGYFLEVRGKSGEVRPNQAVCLNVFHRDFKDTVFINVQSDENGHVALGELRDISRLEATLAGGSKRDWYVNDFTTARTSKINAAEGELIEVVAPKQMGSPTRGEVALFEKRRGVVVADHFDAIQFDRRRLFLDGLKAGDYVLHLKKQQQEIAVSVLKGEKVKHVVLGDHRRGELRDATPLAVSDIEVAGGKMLVNIVNANDSTRVHVVATRYQPGFNSFSELNQVADIQPWLQNISVRRSAYMAGRSLSDEYQYILNRRFAAKYPGNMLDQPSLLVQPWATKDTANNIESLAAGNDFQNGGTEKDKAASRGRQQRREAGNARDFANLDFLKQSSVVVANQKPNDDGAVVIDLSQLKGLQHVRVVVVDSLSTIQREINLTTSELEQRDLRLANALDANDHFAQMKQIEALEVGDVLKLEDLVSGKFHYFDDLGDVFRLYLTLNPNTRLSDFEFLLSWSHKTQQEKQELYSKYACHELNFYLSMKDKPFFESVVVPHVGFKLEQGFMDQFLTGQQTERYADQQFEFAQLNVFERILLAQTLEQQSVSIVRSIDDLYLLNPVSRQYFDGLYDTSIQTGALVLQDKFSDYDERQALPKLAAIRQSNKAVSDQPSRLGGAGVGGGGGGGRRGKFGASPGQDPSAAVANSLAFGVDQLQAPKEDSEQLGRDMKAFSQNEIRGELAGEQRKNSKQFYKRLKKHESADGDDDFFVDSNAYQKLRDESKSLYRRLPVTKEWIEQQYYNVPLNRQASELVGVNRFWKDYSNHKGGSFLSRYFSESHRSLTEMMFALAVLDLPEVAPEHKFEYENNSMALTAAGPMIAMHQQFQPVVFQPQNTSILVSENFFQKNDRYRHEGGVRYDKFVTEQFYAHTLYGAQVVVTNPTSTPKAIDMLVQIPRGAVSTSGSQDTKSQPIQLDAFSTKTLDYFFYFPTAGEFTHYPAHVSKDDEVLAVAENIEFNVIDQPAELDKSSWGYVSQNGSEEDVIDFLRRKNVLRLDLTQIAFRMKQKSFFERVLTTLKNRFAYNHTLWSYGIHHKDASVAEEFLRHEDRIANQVGRYFSSGLLTVLPYERNWYQHREYSPLVNARVHKVGATHKILNPSFFAQYRSLLDLLSNHSKLTSEDHLVVTYYLLLQNRIEEAITHFGLVDKADLNEEIQFDYCDAYLDFYLENPVAAQQKATKWEQYPVGLWRNRFKNILSQVEEIRGADVVVIDGRDDLQKQTALASQEASFDFEIESGQVKVVSQSVSEVDVNYYEMDIELMFSRSPFGQANLDGFSVVKPTVSKTIKLTGGKRSSTEFDLPSQFANKNVLVEIRAGDQVKSKPNFANSMAVQTIEKFGQLHVTSDDGKQPVAKAYVKVYSQNSNGQVKFHKDGYTDLRGRFDYVSQSNNPLDGIQRYSILVLSPESGAITRQVFPPAE